MTGGRHHQVGGRTGRCVIPVSAGVRMTPLWQNRAWLNALHDPSGGTFGDPALRLGEIDLGAPARSMRSIVWLYPGATTFG